MRILTKRRFANRAKVGTLVASYVVSLVPTNGLGAGSSTSAAAPWIILIEGERPGTRIVLGDWAVNLKVMRAVSRPMVVDSRSLVSRPSLRVALFWGPQWVHWRAARIDPDTLAFERANQHARLYRARSKEQPVWVFAPTPFAPTPFAASNLVRGIDSSGVALLVSRGVPLRVP